MGVRLYGRAIGNGSLSVVTAGFKQALENAGILEGFLALDKSGGDGDEENDEPPGALARDGVFTGNLNLVPTMRRNARHERNWVQVTPNSTHIPRYMLQAILDLPNPRILSASNWGTSIICQELYRMGALGAGGVLHTGTTGASYQVICEHLEIHTMRHGVSGFASVPGQLEKARADYNAGSFRVIHFSTTEGERKGTLELVQAWAILQQHEVFPKDAELWLVLDHHANRALRERAQHIGLTPPPRVRMLPRGDMGSATMSHVLCGMHLVAAPSRGEGFGLLPLQARACGVPVVATVTTGHSAGHVEGPGVVIIPQPERMEAIDDGPGAMAPPVLPNDIAESILFAHREWSSLAGISQDAATDVAHKWRWQAQLEPLVKLLR